MVRDLMNYIKFYRPYYDHDEVPQQYGASCVPVPLQVRRTQVSNESRENMSF